MSNKNKDKNTPVITGTDGEDTLVASGEESKINGGDSNDVIVGTSGPDRINAGDGDDTINGGAGDDTIFGNDGLDTAVFAGDVRDYSITEGKGNSRIVSGPDGSDTLKHIEVLRFDNLDIDLDGSNNSPLVEDVALTVPEDGSASIDLLADAWDYEGDDLVVVGGEQVFTFAAAGSYESLAVGETATEEFSFSVSDGSNEVERSLTVTIEGTNDNPVAVEDAIEIGEKDAPVSGNVLSNDSDIDASDELSVTGVNGAAIGAVTLASGAIVTMGADGSYSYDLAGAFAELEDGETGYDSFSYDITDGNGGIASATVTVAVSGVSEPGGTGGQAQRSGLATDYLDLGLGEIVDYNNAFWNAGTFGTEDADIWLYDLWYSYASSFYMQAGGDVIQFRADPGNGFYANRFYMEGGDNTLALVMTGNNYIANNLVGKYLNDLSGNDTVKFQSNGGEILNNSLWLQEGDNYISMQINDSTDDSISHQTNVRASGNLFDAVGGNNTFILQVNVTEADTAIIRQNTLRNRGTDGENLMIIEQNTENATNAEVIQNNLTGGGGNDVITIFGADDALNDNARVYYNNLNGGDGDDVLTIVTDAAGSGNNYLYGGGGNDRLETGAGVDVMYGHDGDDVFAFNDTSGNDRINDFGRGADLIDLSQVTGVNDYGDLTIAHVSGTLYSVDLGNGSAIDVTLVGGHTLSPSDFLFA